MILVSLQTTNNNLGALGLLEAGKGFRYLQIENKSEPANSGQIRGIDVVDRRVYALTQAGLRIYQLELVKDQVVFKREREIVHPDWVIGEHMQANLLPLHVSSERQAIFVGNNSQFSVDELDLDGKLRQRHFLWDIAPEQFCLPRKYAPGYVYGHIRTISSTPGGKILLVIANRNNTDEGIVVDFESGRVLLSRLHTPSGGEVLDDGFFLLNVRHGELSRHPFSDAGNVIQERADWAVIPKISNPEYKDSLQHMRGLSYDQTI